MSERPPAAAAGWSAGLRRRVDELGVVITGFYLIVVVIAAVSAVALLAFPGSTESYFSWGLGNRRLAAVLGGLYLASTTVFGWALTRDHHETRALSVGVLGLALPTLALTFLHRSAFEWDRPQAIGWVVLFLTAPVTIAIELRRPAVSIDRTGLPSRLALTLLSASAAVLALATWWEPSRSWLSDRGPFPIAGLAGRYLGSWALFIALMAAAAAIRGDRAGRRMVGVTLVAVAGGVVLGLVRADLTLPISR